MRRISAFFLALILFPIPGWTDAQFTADDIIRHFKNSSAARQAPQPAETIAAPADEAPIKLPLTGAKRSVTVGNANSRTRSTGTSIGKTVASPGLDLLITFESGSDTLTDQARRNLDAFAQALQSPALAGYSFEVQGHTDARGAASVNMRLSQRRAESVVTYLVDHGVDGKRLRARGYGEDQPIMSDPNHPRNRRVETRRIQ